VKKYLTTALLWASLLLSEFHTFWEKASQEPVNWIISRNVPMSVQWNVKMVSDQLWYILVFVAMLFYVPNRINRSSVLAMIVFSVADTGMYFYNYKTYDYIFVYPFLFTVWILIYRYGTHNKPADRRRMVDKA